MSSLEDLLQTCAGRGKDALNWAAYVGMVSLSPLTSNGHLEAQEEAAALPVVEQAAYILLLKLFDLTDTDKDETLTESEVLQLFAELDGAATDLDSFRMAISRVVGGTPGVEAKLTDILFVKTRVEYARVARTLSGGVRLQGRLLARAAVDTVRITEAEIENRMPEDISTVLVSPTGVMTTLPDSLLDASVLPCHCQVSVLVSALPNRVTCGQLEDAVCGLLSRFGGKFKGV